MRQEGRRAVFWEPEAVEDIAGTGPVPVSPRPAMLVGDWERLPAGAEGLHEGIAKGGIKIADQDEGGGGIVGEQGLHESDKGFHFGGSEPQGIRVGRIVGKAAFQVQVEKPVRGAIQGKPDLLDTALQGAVGKPECS